MAIHNWWKKLANWSPNREIAHPDAYFFMHLLPLHIIINIIQIILCRCMNKLIRTARMIQRTPFWFSQQKNLSPPIPEVRVKNTFFGHVYGLELRSHIFPNFKKTMALSDEEVKFYQKVSPNYVVALIRKVLDDSNDLEPQTITVNDYFYEMCTYCRIKYGNGNVVELEGLYRAKIEKIKEITME